MKTFKALAVGIRSTNKSWRMIVLLYVLNFLVAAILAWGFRSVLMRTIGDSMNLERVAKDFDYTVFADFMFKYGARISSLVYQLSWLVIFNLLMSTFLGGGTIALLKDKEGSFSMRAFFENCGNYFFRFLRLFLVFGAILFLVGFIATAAFGMVYSILTAGAVSEVFPFTLGIMLFLLFLFILMLVTMMADYAKVATVVTDAESMLKISWQGIKFVFRHFLSTVLLQLFLVIILLAAVAIYLIVDSQFAMATPIAVLVVFIIQQISVGFKVWTRVAAYGGELELFDIFKPEPDMPAAISVAPEPVQVVPAAVVPPLIPVSQARPERIRKTRNRISVRRAPARQKKTKRAK